MILIISYHNVQWVHITRRRWKLGKLVNLKRRLWPSQKPTLFLIRRQRRLLVCWSAWYALFVFCTDWLLPFFRRVITTTPSAPDARRCVKTVPTTSRYWSRLARTWWSIPRAPVALRRWNRSRSIPGIGEPPRRAQRFWNATTATPALAEWRELLGTALRATKGHVRVRLLQLMLRK